MGKNEFFEILEGQLHIFTTVFEIKPCGGGEAESQKRQPNASDHAHEEVKQLILELL